MSYQQSAHRYSQAADIQGMTFQDRREAGRLLARKLGRYKDANGIVLALPRGGVPVGYEVALALRLPIDVFIVRKLGAPGQPELGIGAVAPGGVLVLDVDTINALGISREAIQRIATIEVDEVERRLARFRGRRPSPELAGKTVIVVDDGLATGVTATAAVRALRQANPKEIVLAVPVCAAQTADALESEVDQLVCVETPPNFGAVGLWYRHFDQTSDEEVIELLEQARLAYEGHENQSNAQGEPASSALQDRVRGQVAAPLRQEVEISSAGVTLQGDLMLPEQPLGVVLFAHGSGSSRLSPRNRYVAGVLHNASFATLLMDLLTSEEELIDNQTRHLRFDIALLAQRLAGAIDWLGARRETAHLAVGLFGASTGAAAALVAAANRPEKVRAVVSRGGRPDLAGAALPHVEAPTLLLVGGLDQPVIGLNRQAMEHLSAPNKLVIVPGATHLFEEPGTLEEVARLAAAWFTDYLAPPTQDTAQ